MHIVDLIEKKKKGCIHTKDEIDFIVKNYTNGSIEDYQMSAWLMAVCFQGLNEDETVYLTQSYIESGDTLDFSGISDCIADKHSTGGVGDKVTIVLIPILASLGIYTAKLSGRGLGFTGGTIDKLESIPNFRTELKKEEFLEQIKKIKVVISSQSPNLTPADGKIYALRDVTATVDNMSLICASVVSKKIASGANSVVLDVTYGSGAFLKTKEEAQKLGNLMLRTAKKLNKNFDIVISSMEQPLGYAVGNSLEVIEGIEFLKGKKIEDLYNVVLDIAIKTLANCNITSDPKEAKSAIDKVIENGGALNKLKELISYQGGNVKCIEDYSLFNIGNNTFDIKSKKAGCITKLDALNIAKAAKLLGAGRDKKTDFIDYGAGIVLNKKVGSYIKENETVLVLYFNDTNDKKLSEAKEYLNQAIEISTSKDF